ncbi:uncharacterized mitochondrial protein-like protein [Tanacetum coccineum]
MIIFLLPLWTADPPYSQDPKSSHDDRSKPSSDDGKKVDEDLRKDNKCKDQEKEDNVNSTNNVNTADNVNTVSSTVNVADTNEVKVVGGKTSIKLPFDTNMPALEDDSIFDFSRDDEDDGVVADMNNLEQHSIWSKLTRFLFFKIHKHDICWLFLCLDDIIFGSTKKELCIAFEKLMHEYILDDSMDEILTFFFGLQVKQKKDGIFISQDIYVAEILKKFRFTEVKTVSTPMETQKALLKDEKMREEPITLLVIIPGASLDREGYNNREADMWILLQVAMDQVLLDFRNQLHNYGLKDVASSFAAAVEEKKKKHMVPSLLTMELSKLLGKLL